MVHRAGTASAFRATRDFVTETVERYQGEVLLIRRQFERLRPDRIRRFFRQREGDELDMDALIEALADRAAGRADERQASSSGATRRSAKSPCLFLLDMSDSTDQLVDEDRRVIDVEKEGLVLLAEAISQLDDQYAIMGFSSTGRQARRPVRDQGLRRRRSTIGWRRASAAIEPLRLHSAGRGRPPWSWPTWPAATPRPSCWCC